MHQIKILFADNSPDFLNTRAEFLKGEGYRLIKAYDYDEAEEKLAGGEIDLAILDMRLKDDSDEKDMSGLILAEKFSDSIPSIILTSFPTVDAVRTALRTKPNGLQPAIDLVSKDEGPDILIASIKRSVAVHLKKHPKRILLDVSLQLEKDYEESRKQALLTHRVRLVLIIAGTLVIIGGALSVILGYTTAGTISVLSGSLAQLLAAFFSKLSEDANKRMDNYHRELLQLYVNQGES
jgi:DNA-binding NtrC family response regulator